MVTCASLNLSERVLKRKITKSFVNIGKKLYFYIQIMNYIMKIVTLLLAMLFPVALCAQEVQVLKQHNMKKWGMPAGNYSGITPIGGNGYAFISDKQETDGWTETTVSFEPSGDFNQMMFIAHHYNVNSQKRARDSEGIVYVHGQGFFVSAEDDQQIIEISLDGLPTRRSLSVPTCYNSSNIFPNYGFESLAYNKEKGIFWTTTEQGLRSDVSAPSSPENPQPTLLRIQSFGSDMQPLHQYAYKTDAPITRRAPRHYAFGVSEMLVLNDTTLLVMERELNIPEHYNRAKCNIRIYSVNPEQHKPITDTSKPLSEMDSSAFLTKKLVCAFNTEFRIFGRKNLANYEGMCLGPKLPDGRQTILLVSDSQNRAGNVFFHLKDYIRVIVINN